MFVIIMGCGRVGARVASQLSRAGHEVTILDTNSHAFRRLDPDFAVTVIREVGNYGEIFDRNVGPDTPLALERGVNALWRVLRMALRYRVRFPAAVLAVIAAGVFQLLIPLYLGAAMMAALFWISLGAVASKWQELMPTLPITAAVFYIAVLVCAGHSCLHLVAQALRLEPLPSAPIRHGGLPS